MAKKYKSFLGFQKTDMKRSDFVKTYTTFDGRKINYANDLRNKDISKLSAGDIVFRGKIPYVVEDTKYTRRRSIGREIKCTSLRKGEGIIQNTYINEASKRFFYKH